MGMRWNATRALHFCEISRFIGARWKEKVSRDQNFKYVYVLVYVF